jgi:ketosteroid isomerase-like protein
MSAAADIFAHHLEVFGNGDMEGILSDYSEDSVMMYGDKQFTGLAGAREFFNLWLNDWIPAGSRFDLIDKQTSDDMVYITWTAESENYVFDFGTDTFIMKNGKVWRQTVATAHRKK